MDVLATCGGPVILGRTGENDYTVVVFPFDGPAGASVTIFNRLPGSASSYPVAAVEVQNGTVRWTVSSADLSVNGYGECEITYTLGDVVAKSVRYPTQVIASLDGQGDPPEGWDTWEAVFTALKAQAEAAAQTATDAAQTATEASEAIQNLSVSSTTLTPGSPATVEKTVDPETGAVSLEFGIPEGRQGGKGDTGETPDISIGTVTTGAAGSDASATMTGTAENPVLNLTIPRGDAGKDGEPGKDGDTGPAGISPTVTVTDITGGHRITITDADGPHSIDVLNGESGVQDVQVNGVSVLDAQGVANVPIANSNTYGVVRTGSVSVTGSTPTINALPGIQYVCGEVSTLEINCPTSGTFDVVFESGSTATVLTVTPPTGMTVEWSNDFDPASLAANTVYEVNISVIGNRCLGVAGSWT